MRYHGIVMPEGGRGESGMAMAERRSSLVDFVNREVTSVVSDGGLSNDFASACEEHGVAVL